MVMDAPTLPRIKVRDHMMQAILTGWTRSDKAVSQDEYLQSSIQEIELLQVEPENLSAEESAVIGKINEGTYGKLTFYSPDHGRYITRTMHVESHTAERSDAAL